MDINQLREVFTNDEFTKKIFHDVLALDQFMNEEFKESSFMCIVNDQISILPGNHWLLVYKDVKKVIFIDSLGRTPEHYGLTAKLKTFRKPIYQISKRLQCLDSLLCGGYVAYFGYCLARGEELEKIMERFSENCRDNDLLMYLFITRKI